MKHIEDVKKTKYKQIISKNIFHICYLFCYFVYVFIYVINNNSKINN